MGSYGRWADIRAEHVAQAGGEEVVEADKQELLAEMIGHRLAEIRNAGAGLSRWTRCDV